MGKLGPPRRRRLAVRETLREALLQVSDASFLLARTSSTTWTASLTHCRSKAISDGVNIRGAGEVPSLRLSRVIEGVAENLLAPVLEACAVFLSERMELLLCGVQLCRLEFSRQGDSAHHPATLFLGPFSQIRQPSALADEIVRHEAIAPLGAAFNGGLTGKTSVTVIEISSRTVHGCRPSIPPST